MWILDLRTSGRRDVTVFYKEFYFTSWLRVAIILENVQIVKKDDKSMYK